MITDENKDRALCEYELSVQELKQQLGEKEKTIQDLIKAQEFLERSCSYQMLLDTQKENILLKQQLKQAQKQVAIEELEFVLKNFRNRPAYFDVARQELCLSNQDKQFIDFINNRIKELKGVDVHA